MDWNRRYRCGALTKALISMLSISLIRPVKRCDCMRIINWLMILGSMMTVGGCFASARHVSSVRPDVVRSIGGVGQRFRLAKIILRKSKGADANTHDEQTEKVFSCVENSLLKNYPTVFTKEMEGTPLTVLVDWSFKYSPVDLMAPSSLLTRMFFPERVEQETIYYVRTLGNAQGLGEPELWAEFNASREMYPQPSENTAAARCSEIKETWILPIGFIPVAGESNWPKSFCFMRQGKDSPVMAPSETALSKDCFSELVFEPKTDGDVIAAAIMKSINRQSYDKNMAIILDGKGEMK